MIKKTLKKLLKIFFKALFQTQRKTVSRWRYQLAIVFSLVSLLAHVFTQASLRYQAYAQEKRQEWINSLITPIADVQREYVYKTHVVEVPQEMIDTWVHKYIEKYFVDHHRRSEMKMIMHCLLHRESAHQELDANGGHGDGGRAGGILQFHQPTWNGYRKIMIDRGHITETGSRYNAEQGIETTIWAISDGRAKAWGPIYRTMNNEPIGAECPAPSWY